VVDVFSGDSISVKEDNAKESTRMFLAHVKAPRVANQNRSGEPLGFEAKDHLRKLLIGKQVKVEVEYTRSRTIPLEQMDDPTAQPQTIDMVFANVFLQNDSMVN
jgi:staphylococcal nuclease domain-containing protein 1